MTIIGIIGGNMEIAKKLSEKFPGLTLIHEDVDYFDIYVTTWVNKIWFRESLEDCSDYLLDHTDIVYYDKKLPMWDKDELIELWSHKLTLRGLNEIING